MQIKAALHDGTQQLAQYFDTARLDAELLLCHTLDRTRSYLYTWPEKTLSPTQQQSFQALITQRVLGHPIAHLTGQREFWSMPLKVSADTLIPRPETELLVEQALLHIPTQQTYRVLDLGTGTGAIALAIAKERPHASVTATDLSHTTLDVARLNAQQLGLYIRLVQSDWFTALAQEQFDIIISNPPYIAEQDEHLTQGDVRFEPSLALSSGADGMDALRTIITTAMQHLNHGGWLLLEHGYDQGTAIPALLQAAGFQHAHCQQDLSGNDRISLGMKPHQ